MPALASASASNAAAAPTPPAKARKLSYKEQRELDELPARMAALEAEQKALGEQLADPDIYKKDPHKLPIMQARFDEIDVTLLTLLERWEQLSA